MFDFETARRYQTAGDFSSLKKAVEKANEKNIVQHLRQQELINESLQGREEEEEEESKEDEQYIDTT